MGGNFVEHQVTSQEGGLDRYLTTGNTITSFVQNFLFLEVILVRWVKKNKENHLIFLIVLGELWIRSNNNLASLVLFPLVLASLLSLF